MRSQQAGLNDANFVDDGRSEKAGGEGLPPGRRAGDDEVLYDNQESPTLTVLVHVWYPTLSDILSPVARRLGSKSSGSFFSGLPSGSPLRGSLFGFAEGGIGADKAYRRKPKESLLRGSYGPSRILGRIWRTVLEEGFVVFRDMSCTF